ncbi:YozD family protein [Paenibacillus sp. MWE-103]|uniref:YozD family protein n=1 Tax=Paenibacillus artemisiicola TaxID=1172618 RepID=A0ABS3WHZ2_9BACL|nr:YozD family protein [Paenibacillus artemisiicola]MBO7747923.1 YozD family protein [Paenibacillus artemisiicola]
MKKHKKQKNVKYRTIESSEIEDYFFDRLVERGCVPTQNDIEIITEIVFDFLQDNGVAMNVNEKDEG